MKLLACLITYNRLEYTKRTLSSFINATTVPYHLVIVDNGSTDGTVEWLSNRIGIHVPISSRDRTVIFNEENGYPGKATNQGWESGIELYPKATHLMRLDNDMGLRRSYDKRVEQYFRKIPILGQLGLDHSALDTWNGNTEYLTTVNNMTVNSWPGNVGGPCVIRREVWDKGARYDETPWHNDKTDKPTAQEDVLFSLSMHKYGYIYGHPTENLASTFANETNWYEYPNYYRKTMGERGYDVDHILG